MAGTVNCPRCQWPIQIGNVSGGVRIMCPKCSAAVVLKDPGSAAQSGGQRISGARGTSGATRAVPQRARPERSTPLMRKVNRASVTGARRSRGDDEEAVGRMSAYQKPKSNNGLYVGIGIAAVAVIIIVIVVATGGKRKEEPKKKKTPATPAASVTPKTPAKAPTPEKPTFTKFTPFIDDPREAEGKVENIDAATASELDKMLKDSGAKGGDPQIRERIVAEANKYFPILVDRLLSNEEAIFKEAVVMACDIATKMGVSGVGDLETKDMSIYYDPDKRKSIYATFIGLWGKKSFKEDLAIKKLGGGPPSKPNAPPDNVSTPPVANPGDNPPSQSEPTPQVDVSDIGRLVSLPLGGDEVTAAAEKIRAQGPSAYKELVKYIDSDIRKAQNAVRILNVIAGKDWQENPPKESNWQQIKQDWENWASKQ